MKYYTCRYPNKAHASGLCLAPTVDGVNCPPHVGIAALDSLHAEAIKDEFLRRPLAPPTQSAPLVSTFKWPGTEETGPIPVRWA